MITGSTTGTKYVMMFKWNPTDALRLVERERVNAIVAVPTIVWQLLESPESGKVSYPVALQSLKPFIN